jgi:hypothetical protein
MKIIFKFLIILLLFSFSEANAQKNDSTGTTLLMKRKSKIYIAEIETKIGIQKGILYEADSSGIVILDSMYQRISIPLQEMKSLKIYRSNAALYGAKVGFLISAIPFTALGALFFVSSGVLLNGFTEAFFLTGLAGGVIYGIIFAIINPLIPHTTIRNVADFPEKYYKKLRYFKPKTQKNLFRYHPKQVRLI